MLRPPKKRSVIQPASNMPVSPESSKAATIQAALGDFDVLGFGQQRRPPTQHGVTDDVDEEIGEGEEPDIFVAEDVFEEKRAEIVFDLGSLAGDVRSFHFGQAEGFGRVGQRFPKINGAKEREAAGTKKQSRQLGGNSWRPKKTPVTR